MNSPICPLVVSLGSWCYYLHSFVVNDMLCVSGLLTPKVDNHLFGFHDVQDEIIVTPVHRLLDLLSIGHIIVVSSAYLI